MDLMKPEDFDFNTRAYPFEDGEVEPGIIVDAAGVYFCGQRGPIKEVGRNGCDIVSMIEFARMTLLMFNQKIPSHETELAIGNLQEAEMWLLKRRQNREARDVEGTSKL